MRHAKLTWNFNSKWVKFNCLVNEGKHVLLSSVVKSIKLIFAHLTFVTETIILTTVFFLG